MTNDINKVKVMGSNLAMDILLRLEELHCVTKEHPARYSLHGPAISDQAAITQTQAHGSGPRRAGTGPGLPIPAPGYVSKLCAPPACHGE